MDSREIARKMSQNQSELAEMKTSLRQLVERVDRQVLVIQVLKDMLLGVSGCSEDQYLARLAHAAEKRATEEAGEKVCGKCGKPISPKHSRCMYCGEPRPSELL
jgi:hypothetical protein